MIINEEYLIGQINQMDMIILKAQGAREILAAQLEYVRSEQKQDGKEQTEKKKAGPQPGRSESEYANGSACKTGDCD